uniref:Solute carrier family 25 member 46 n=1 Tax=Periophthalmus magnuspinnatus TaxID=409849 RepID=A0A3B3ZB41_9GOBI
MTSRGGSAVTCVSSAPLFFPCSLIGCVPQVNVHARCYHLTPFSAVSVMYSISKAQGVRSLWKGMGSTFIVHGVTLGAEGIISEFTPLPRWLDTSCSKGQSAPPPLSLLFSSFCLSPPPPFVSFLTSSSPFSHHTPPPPLFSLLPLSFFSSFSSFSSSSSSFFPPPPPLFSLPFVLFLLLLFLLLLFLLFLSSTSSSRIGAPHSRRLLPLSSLLFPAALHAVLKYCVSTCVQRVALWLLQRRRKEVLLCPSSDACDPLDSYFVDLASQWAGSLFSDVLCFPLETVLHRLALQGTRTIIDHTEQGGALQVLPVNTQYDGFSDCLSSVRHKEGAASFYRGFGALTAQYALHAALKRLHVFSRFIQMLI